MRPKQETKRSTHCACWPAKGSHATAIVVDEELEIEQEAVARGEATEHVLPAALILVAVREKDVRVLERIGFGRRIGQFLHRNVRLTCRVTTRTHLEAENIHIERCILPGGSLYLNDS